ncbi:MAG: DNA-binding response regulator [unclassified Hahellaceae]|nr:DNA-binding response regulator [Hahellaceae bacterium]|tara:strand:+ start:36117 stop:36851 length:735 start_codon:yes stop_codon:yes gene_type:complete
MSIILLEDDQGIADNVRAILASSGISCQHFSDGERFLYAALNRTWDLAIMDWQLPGRSGVEVLRDLRMRQRWAMPVLFLTQRDDESDIIMALDAGADDYMIKPPRSGELCARVRALCRRVNSTQDESAEQASCFGSYQFDFDAGTVTINGETPPLTDMDFKLARFMFENCNRLLTREYLLEQIWGLRGGLKTRTVDTHISKLRRLLQLYPENGFRVKTVYQRGYRLESVDSTASADTETADDAS